MVFGRILSPDPASHVVNSSVKNKRVIVTREIVCSLMMCCSILLAWVSPAPDPARRE